MRYLHVLSYCRPLGLLSKGAHGICNILNRFTAPVKTKARQLLTNLNKCCLRGTEKKFLTLSRPGARTHASCCFRWTKESASSAGLPAQCPLRQSSVPCCSSRNGHAALDCEVFCHPPGYDVNVSRSPGEKEAGLVRQQLFSQLL